MMETGPTRRQQSLSSLGALAIILVCGILLRFQALEYTEQDFIPHGDAARYLLYAYNLRNFGIYSHSDFQLYPPDKDAGFIRENVEPDALVAPGYPLFLSLFLGGEYTGQQFDTAVLAQVVLSSITILLAYLVFAAFGRVYGLVAAALTALSPHLINMNLFLLTETLFCFFLLGFLFLLSRIRTNSGILLFLATGLLLGFATLTRPWIQGFLLILLFYVFFSRLRTGTGKPLVLTLGFLLPVAPWLLWNYLMFGSLGDPSLTIKSIHHGMYPYMMYNLQPETLGYPYLADPEVSKFAHSLETIMRELKARYAANPALYLEWYLVGKLSTVFSWSLLAGASDVFVYQVADTPYHGLPHFYISRYYMEKIHPVLVILSLAGALMVWLPDRMLRLPANALFVARAVSLLLAYFIILHIIGAPFPRYSIPLRPITYGMALFPVLVSTRIFRALPGSGDSRPEPLQDTRSL